MSERIEIVTEVTILPTGMELDDIEMHHFAVKVVWRGPRTETGSGGYAVIKDGERHMSKQGKWRWNPEPFIRRHYRWEHLEEALAAAREVVDTLTVTGRTFEQWLELRAARTEQ